MHDTTVCPGCGSDDINWTRSREDYKTKLTEYKGACQECGVDLDGIAAPGYPVRVLDMHPTPEDLTEVPA